MIHNNNNSNNNNNNNNNNSNLKRNSSHKFNKMSQYVGSFWQWLARLARNNL